MKHTQGPSDIVNPQCCSNDVGYNPTNIYCKIWVFELEIQEGIYEEYLCGP